MDDTISRQAAVDLVEEVENKRLKGEIDLTYAPMINGIKALPPAQPGWIPSECGENVPEVGDAVLVTFKDSNGKADVYIARWGGNFYDCGYYCLSVSEVLAWMPLPAPWEGEKP